MDRQNIALFIDYENVHKNLLKQKKNIIGEAFFEKFRQYCKEKNKRIVKIFAYCNFDIEDLYESHHQSRLQSYGVETIHTSNQGKNYADIQMTIDIMNFIHSNNNIDEFYIMSNDKDMIPLLNTIRIYKRNVIVITTGDEYNKSILNFVDTHLNFEDISKISIDSEIIKEIKENFISGLNENIEYKISQFQSSSKYNHFDIDYALQNDGKYNSIMVYELANILKQLKKDNKIIFYEYQRNSNSYISYASKEKLEKLKDLKILNENDILPSYDISLKVDELYDRYIQKYFKR